MKNTKEYDKETKKMARKYRVYYPGILFLISLILVLLFVFNTNTVGSFLSFGIGLLVNILFYWYCNAILLKKEIEERKRRKDRVVAQMVDEELKAKIQ